MKSTILAPLSGLVLAAAFGLVTVSRSAARGPSVAAVPLSTPEAAPSPSIASSPPLAPAVAQHAAHVPREPEPPAVVPLATEEETAAEVPAPLEQARALRLPIVSAIRNTSLTDDAKHRAMRDALARSGSSTESWTRDAMSTFNAWTRSMTGVSLELDGRGVACYRAGCEALVAFPDRASYERAATAFRSIQELGASHGGRVQTPPLTLPDGRVQAAWMFLRPDVPLPPGEGSESNP